MRDASTGEREAALREFARELRVCVLQVIKGAGLGHVGGDFSVADTLATLFGAVLRYDPANPGWPERDRFILSKGHCSASLYSVLAMSGFIPTEQLATFAKPLSALNGHPNRQKVPGVETNTGPLGHGLPVAVGCALAARLTGADWRAFVVLGDGELQEGSNWEAIMFAGHKGLANLTAIVDRNRLQQGARTEDTNRLDPLADKWRAFGWEVHEVDGHDYTALYEVLTAPRADRPRCVIANTFKGKGVSFMEDRVEWHHKVPSAEQFEQAIIELGAAA
jgi:transketolase